MENTYTKTDLISFIYKEVSPKEALLLKREINSNWLLREEYKLLKEAYQALPKVKFSPKKDTLQKILGYSQSPALEVC